MVPKEVMGLLDRETQQRVWQRVLGQQDWNAELLQLIRLCRIQTEELRTLDRVLWQEEKQILQFLTGLYRLGAGGSPSQEPLPAGVAAQRLARCRGRCEEMLALCIRLENHPRYGAVFTDLARQRRAMCAQLASLGEKR